jgi:hypothetical protein
MPGILLKMRVMKIIEAAICSEKNGMREHWEREDD